MFLSGLFIFTHLDAFPHFLLYFFHSLLCLTPIPESPRTTLSFKYVKRSILSHFICSQFKKFTKIPFWGRKIHRNQRGFTWTVISQDIVDRFKRKSDKPTSHKFWSRIACVGTRERNTWRGKMETRVSAIGASSPFLSSCAGGSSKLIPLL